ncbi:twin-arginine translocation pathway signal protein [Amylibacter sp. SFDW26]|uniref:Acg family FMN-binding oxidoreductase n=1 Tax=Amylibacter sp. SFDW26 TaxID=2652722 RepID=UPI0012628718|nr:twin-arginine translocation pathway signal protein [Amylibacter sp. SFDW26]KAB7615398.1 twin-arginine translocation pathway signal protein [Amylibacter sp. SFDW26]
MTLSRRKALTLIGGGTIFAAGTAAAGFLGTRTPHKALAPWQMAGGYKDIRKWALSYALLAPNAHNRQPWLIGLEGDDKVIIWRDKDRELPETDPFHRQLVISFGCFLEQMRIAAAERNTAVNLDIYPEGENGPVAVATFGGATQPDPLFAAILDRRTCREPYENRPVENTLARELEAYAKIHSHPDIVSKIKDITIQAWHIEAHHPETYRESVDLMRFGKSEMNANPDGISIGGPFLESLMLAGFISRKGQENMQGASFKYSYDFYNERLLNTNSYAVITTKGNTRQDQLEAGRKWIRLNLTTTLTGLSLHPVSQALQEFPEMAEPYKNIHDILAKGDETVQMLGRLGYGPKTQPTPRWPLETRLI